MRQRQILTATGRLLGGLIVLGLLVLGVLLLMAVDADAGWIEWVVR